MYFTSGGPVPVKMNGHANKELSSGNIDLIDSEWFCKLVQMIHWKDPAKKKLTSTTWTYGRIGLEWHDNISNFLWTAFSNRIGLDCVPQRYSVNQCSVQWQSSRRFIHYTMISESCPSVRLQNHGTSAGIISQVWFTMCNGLAINTLRGVNIYGCSS